MNSMLVNTQGKHDVWQFGSHGVRTKQLRFFSFRYVITPKNKRIREEDMKVRVLYSI